MKKENVVIKKECHSRGMLSGIYNACRYYKKEKDLSNEYVEDPRLQHSGMTALFDTPSSPLWGTSPARGEVNGGFTLIELLVVVLIIGILAAVAVPQYKLAVAKSRLTQGLVFVKAVGEAQEAFYLANGQYADDINKLDISISCPDKLSCTTTQSVTDVGFLSYGNLYINYRYLHQEEIPEYQGLLYCSCRKNIPEAVKICSHFGKKATRENPSNPDWDIYRIN